MYSNPPMGYPYHTPSFPYYSTIDTTPTTPSFPSFPWELFTPYYIHGSSSPILYPNHGYSPHPPNPNPYSSYFTSHYSYHYTNYHEQLQQKNTSTINHKYHRRDFDKHVQVAHPYFKKRSKKRTLYRNIFECPLPHSNISRVSVAAIKMVLFHETTVGYALFEARGIDEMGKNTEAVRNSVSDLTKFSKVVKPHSNSFTSALEDLEQINVVFEGIMTDELRTILEASLPKVKEGDLEKVQPSLCHSYKRDCEIVTEQSLGIEEGFCDFNQHYSSPVIGDRDFLVPDYDYEESSFQSSSTDSDVIVIPTKQLEVSSSIVTESIGCDFSAILSPKVPVTSKEFTLSPAVEASFEPPCQINSQTEIEEGKENLEIQNCGVATNDQPHSNSMEFYGPAVCSNINPLIEDTCPDSGAIVLAIPQSPIAFQVPTPVNITPIEMFESEVHNEVQNDMVDSNDQQCSISLELHDPAGPTTSNQTEIANFDFAAIEITIESLASAWPNAVGTSLEPLTELGIHTEIDPQASKVVAYIESHHPTEETDIKIVAASEVSVETENGGSQVEVEMDVLTGELGIIHLPQVSVCLTCGNEVFEEVILGTKLSILFVAIPFDILAQCYGFTKPLVFTLSLLGLIPLAEQVSFLTEEIAYYTCPTAGRLLNATCGNATELIMEIFALSNNKIDVVKYSLLGSILSNLLVLGTSLLCGDIENIRAEKKFDRSQAYMNSLMFLLALLYHLLPLLFQYGGVSVAIDADSSMQFSRFASIMMEIAYLIFQLLTHRNLFEAQDEVNTDCWTNTSRVNKWLQDHNMTANDAYKYFVLKVQHMALSKNRTPVNWEETFNTFPTKLLLRTVIHNWLGSGVCRQVVAKGLRCIFSNQCVWYLVYNNIPLEGIHEASEQQLVLGGEVWVTRLFTWFTYTPLNLLSPTHVTNKATCYSSKTVSLVSNRRITCWDPSEQLKMCTKVWLSKFKQWDPGDLLKHPTFMTGP